jgi:hypothetical protein
MKVKKMQKMQPKKKGMMRKILSFILDGCLRGWPFFVTFPSNGGVDDEVGRGGLCTAAAEGS